MVPFEVRSMKRCIRCVRRVGKKYKCGRIVADFEFVRYEVFHFFEASKQRNAEKFV